MNINENYGIQKVPFIGWKKIVLSEKETEMKIFSSITQEDRFYFIHSYECVPNTREYIIADVDYNKKRVCAVVKKKKYIWLSISPREVWCSWIKYNKKFY